MILWMNQLLQILLKILSWLNLMCLIVNNFSHFIQEFLKKHIKKIIHQQKIQILCSLSLVNTQMKKIPMFIPLDLLNPPVERMDQIYMFLMIIHIAVSTIILFVPLVNHLLMQLTFVSSSTEIVYIHVPKMLLILVFLCSFQNSELALIQKYVGVKLNKLVKQPMRFFQDGLIGSSSHSKI